MSAMAIQSARGPGLPTPERILRAAATLFAANGYHGTSTRDIAAAVGVRQPSLFHHFASKQDIADRLFAIDLTRSAEAATALARADGPAAARLYQYLRFELQVTVTSPYDLRGLYLTDLLSEPEFATWRGVYEGVLGDLAAMVRQGVRSGELVDEDPDLVVQVLNAVITHAVMPAPDAAPASPDRVAALLMRGLLRRPSDLPRVVRAPAAAPLPTPA